VENFFVPEVIAGMCLALYFLLRGGITLFRNGRNGATLNSLAKEHALQLQASREESMISRKEFEDHQRILDDVRVKIERWDDMIHHGDFGCKWTVDQVTLAIDKLDRIEKKLNQ